MTDKLKPAAQKVQQYLQQQELEMQVLQLPDSTRTAVEAANTIGCSVAQIAKSLIFRDREKGTPVLVVASGTNRVSLVKIAQQTSLSLSKADADFVKTQIGFAIGGVPPVAHAKKVVALLDEDLQQYDEIWAAAGTPNAVFKLTPPDLANMSGGSWLDLAE